MTGEHWQKIQAALESRKEATGQLSAQEKHNVAVATINDIFKILRLNDPDITRKLLSKIATRPTNYFGEAGTRIELRWGKQLGFSYTEARNTRITQMGPEIGWVGCDYRQIAADVYKTSIDFPQDRKSSSVFRNHSANTYPFLHQFVPLDEFLASPAATAIPKIKSLMEHPTRVYEMITSNSHPHWFK